MRPPPTVFCFLCCAAAAGCAHPTAPAPFVATEQAAESARREERLKVMQEYWSDRTGASGLASEPGRAEAAPLEYPAGVYAGINFAPRLAVDPSLGEPNR